jgi:hypothetical protein
LQTGQRNLIQLLHTSYNDLFFSYINELVLMSNINKQLEQKSGLVLSVIHSNLNGFKKNHSKLSADFLLKRFTNLEIAVSIGHVSQTT